MNKILKTAAACAVAISTAQAGELIWDLADVAQVASGGYWYTYGDENEKGDDGKGGCTSTDFPEGSDTEDIVTEAWQAVDGVITYTHGTGCDYKYPFAGVGFNWFDPKATVNEQGVDVWAGHTGLCVFYKASGDASFSIEIGTDGAATGYNEFAVSLPKADKLSTGQLFPLSSFAQATGWGTESSLSVVQGLSDAIKFKGTFGEPGTAGEGILQLKKVQWDDCGASSPIIGGGAISAPKMNLAGRTLSFTGISSSATVDLINMQGALVSNGSISTATPSLNVSNISSGVYLVRVKGENLNFTQKVFLK